MSDIGLFKRGSLSKFDPKKTRVIDAQTDAVIEYAKRVKDWPALEVAVDAKIEEQREFVRGGMGACEEVRTRGRGRIFSFDLLWLDGHDYRNYPLVIRKAMLAKTLKGSKRIIYAHRSKTPLRNCGRARRNSSSRAS
jgi:hypothetical protein